MKRQAGFTLVELMVVLAIVGILFFTAIPVYRTWQQRAYGSEAAIMVKQIMDAQILYYLEHDKFFPEDDSSIVIWHDDPSDNENIQAIFNNLNIAVPTGHFLNYTFQSNNIDGDEEFSLQITSQGGFDIFKNTPLIQYTINKDGEIRSDIL